HAEPGGDALHDVNGAVGGGGAMNRLDVDDDARRLSSHTAGGDLAAHYEGGSGKWRDRTDDADGRGTIGGVSSTGPARRCTVQRDAEAVGGVAEIANGVAEGDAVAGEGASDALLVRGPGDGPAVE